MNQENFTNKENIISIKLCKCCGNYALNYRFLTCHLNYESIAAILKGLYEYEETIKNGVENHPFTVKLSGIVVITVLYSDYKIFKEELEEAVISEKGSFNNLTKLIEKFNLSLSN